MELIDKLNIISLLIKRKSLKKNLIQIKKVKFLYQAFRKIKIKQNIIPKVTNN